MKFLLALLLSLAAFSCKSSQVPAYVRFAAASSEKPGVMPPTYLAGDPGGFVVWSTLDADVSIVPKGGGIPYYGPLTAKAGRVAAYNREGKLSWSSKWPLDDEGQRPWLPLFTRQWLSPQEVVAWGITFQTYPGPGDTVPGS